MNHNSIRHNNIRLALTLTEKGEINIDTIRGVVPVLSKKYSDKEIRGIAIESHIKKYQNDFKKIPSIVSNEPK